MKNKLMNKKVTWKRDLRDMVIEVTLPDGSLAYASDQTTVAKQLGCSKAMVGQHMNHPEKYHTCKGCVCRYVDLSTLVLDVDNCLVEAFK